MGLFKKMAPNGGSPYFPYFTELGPWRWSEKEQAWELMIYPDQYQNFFHFRAGMQLKGFADFENWMTPEERAKVSEQGGRVDLWALALHDVWIFSIDGKEGGRELLADRFDKYWREELYANHKFDMSLKRPYRFEDIPFEVDDV